MTPSFTCVSPQTRQCPSLSSENGHLNLYPSRKVLNSAWLRENTVVSVVVISSFTTTTVIVIVIIVRLSSNEKGTAVL